MRKFSLSLDDFSPKPNTSDITWCGKLIDRYPDIKIDLFVPAAYARLNDKKPHLLSDNIEWVEAVKLLPSNYNICLHGMFHRRHPADYVQQQGYPPSNNDELQFLGESAMYYLLDAMRDEFYKVGLDFSNVLRPPGWKISANAVKCLIFHGIKIAGDKTYFDKWKGTIKDLDKHWISYNWDLTGPCDVDGDVIAYGHTSNWTNNYINEERFNLIVDLLDSDEFEFKFIEEML